MEMGIVGDGILCYLLASLISGVATSTASLPADNIKTKFLFIVRKNSSNVLALIEDTKYACVEWWTSRIFGHIRCAAENNKKRRGAFPMERSYFFL